MKPMVGTTYPTVTGENSPKGASFSRIIQELPGMQLWSVYYDNDWPNWTASFFAPEHTGIRWYLLSFKTSDLATLDARLSQMPAHLRGRVIVFLHHEPDQWRSATDHRGDPSPEVWMQRQITFAGMRATAPWRDRIQHWACFTESRFNGDRQVWMNNWGNAMLDHWHVFDGVAWDVFNIGWQSVRSGQNMFAEIVAFNRQAEWPIIIREWGQVTPVDSPEDSQEVADAIREHYDWMKTNVTDLPVGLVWYYNHNNTLTDPSRVRPGRPLSLAALQECLADALAEQPDPEHPQYQWGFTDGAASRQPEVDALNSMVSDLQSQLTDAQNQAATAKQQGRLEAFGEVVIWAQGQA